MLTPLPLIYCPAGVKRPPCWPLLAPVGLLPAKGPDVVRTVATDGSEVITGGGGTMFGGPYVDGSPGWRPTRGGWWVQLLNHKPQDLIRIQRHPRVRQWVTVPGVRPDHQWQVPVLLDRSSGVLSSALDGVWDGERWSGGDLEPLQSQLLALINGVDQGGDTDLAAEVLRLALAGLAVGHHTDADGDLIAVAGWLSESMQLAILNAMAGQAP